MNDCLWNISGTFVSSLHFRRLISHDVELNESIADSVARLLEPLQTRLPFNDSRAIALCLPPFNGAELNSIEDYSLVNWRNGKPFLEALRGAHPDVLKFVDVHSMEKGSQTFPWRDMRPTISPYVRDAIQNPMRMAMHRDAILPGNKDDRNNVFINTCLN